MVMNLIHSRKINTHTCHKLLLLHNLIRHIEQMILQYSPNTFTQIRRCDIEMSYNEKFY